MQNSLKTKKKMPYCPGCGHTITTNNITKALEKMGLSPLDVTMVSDIGCCGIIDPLLTCHTLHGLHGRAVALAMGVSFGLNSPHQKIIAIQGDGGATIGLQHLLEAARQNVDITLIVQNNMIYGMTGGQISGLSFSEFKAVKLPEDRDTPPYNICDLAHRAGASYCERIIAKGDFSDELVDAFSTTGFSIVEIFALCPSYGVKKMNELQQMPFREETIKNARKKHKVHTKKTNSLFDSLPSVEAHLHQPEESGQAVPDERSISDSGIEKHSRTEVLIAGSAGEGVQSAADLLSFAGMASGLNTTKKGEYPITVGTGFSVAEVILSKEEIFYTGIESPDVVIITSEEGLEKIKDRIDDNTLIVMDKSLEIPGGKEAITEDFRKLSGRKGAVLSAIALWLRQCKLFPMETLKEAARTHKHANKLISAIEKI